VLVQEWNVRSKVEISGEETWLLNSSLLAWETYSCHGKGGRDGALEVVGFLVLGTLGVGYDCEGVSY
jgi:hypothetical protein